MSPTRARSGLRRRRWRSINRLRERHRLTRA
ncbi:MULTISPECIES: hypothetical protein [Xanthomonas]